MATLCEEHDRLLWKTPNNQAHIAQQFADQCIVISADVFPDSLVSSRQ